MYLISPHPGVFEMNEQWNKALDQVEDDFLLEAARYQKKRYWPGVAAAAAAVLVLAVGWSVLHPEPTPQPPVNSAGNVTALPDKHGAVAPETPNDAAAPGNSRGEGFWDWLLGGNDPVEQVPPADEPTEEPPYYETLHYDTYEELQTACLEQHRWYLHDEVPVPYLDGQPLVIEDIAVFEQEMYNESWVWYFISHNPHITVRIPTMPSLTANMDPDTSGAEALRQLWPDAPNLHNREEFTDSYSEIREVEITTAEGEKTALYRQEADRDRAYLTFLQNGTLVTISAPPSELDGHWLESFSLLSIGSL